MNNGNADSVAGPPVSNRAFPLLVVLFIGSGTAALIYQVVWFQLLGLVIGASSVSLGVLLGTFMGGMCLGSLLLPRFVSEKHHPLKVYAVLEIGIAVVGVAILFGMPLLGGIYFGTATTGLVGLAIRGVIAGLCLLPPTLLMGATLPAIARWVKTTPSGVAWLGFFYGGNILGAVLGTALAGFVLLRFYDVVVATLVAAAINIAVAIIGLLVASVTEYDPRAGDTTAEEESDEPAGIPAEAPTLASTWPVYVTIGLSGMTALAAEVLWTRHLSLLVGATVYGFALILSVFLTGLGIGSSTGAAIASRVRSPRHALGVCQILLCAMMAWASYTVTQILPYWPVDVTLQTGEWVRTQMDLVRVTWAMLPAAILWGMSFPLALAAAAGRGQDPGRLVGGLYAANTLGAICGSLGVGLIMVPLIGTQSTQQLMIIISAAAGLLMFAPLGASVKEPLKAGTAAFTAAAMVIAVVLASSVRPLPGEVVAYGRFLPVRGLGVNVLYMGEGLTASVAVTEEANGIRNYHNAGKVQASSYPQDMRLQRMLGHLTTLIPPEQEDFLVIGLGAGVTAGAVSIDPGAGSVTIAEIEPLVPEVVSEYFGTHNFDVVDNLKVDIRIDDGRHFLQTTEKLFDGITSDPLDPWVKGAAALYTTEFWQLVKSRLKPGGVVTVFVQLYESTEDAVRSEVATFLDVFTNGAVFANTVSGVGYDVVLFGMADGDQIDVSLVNDRLNRPEYAEVRQSLAEVNFYSAIDLLGTFAGQPADLSDWLAGAPINIDRNLRLQYLAGMGLNLYQADRIFDNMVRGGVEFPEEFFTGSPELLDQLRRAISIRQGRY